MDEMDRSFECTLCEYEDTTVADIHESVQTNIWLAESYLAQGAERLGRECLRAAWGEYLKFRPILTAYAGPRLGDRLREAMASGYVLPVAKTQERGPRGREWSNAIEAIAA